MAVAGGNNGEPAIRDEAAPPNDSYKWLVLQYYEFRSYSQRIPRRWIEDNSLQQHERIIMIDSQRGYRWEVDMLDGPVSYIFRGRGWENFYKFGRLADTDRVGFYHLGGNEVIAYCEYHQL